MASATRCAACALATAALALAGQFGLRTHTTAQGLPHNSINALLQDSRGFIWAATRSGIARYDGRQWRAYTPEGADDDGYTPRLFEDRDGNVWATERLGLACFRSPDMGRPLRIRGPRDAKGRSLMYAIIQAKDGSFWTGGQAGLFRFSAQGAGNEAVFQPVEFAAPGKSGTVLSLLLDRRNELWIGTADALYRRGADGAVRHVASAGMIGWIIEDRRGNVWASTWNDGLLLIEANAVASESPQVRACTTAHGLPTIRVFSLLETASGKLLAGVRGGVVERIDSGAEREPCAFQAAADLQLPVTYARYLAEDREGNLWIGTETGVLQLAASGFQSFSVNDGLTSSSVQSVFESRGELFVVNGHIGLSRFDGRRFESVIPNVSGAKQFPEYGWGTRQTILRDRRGDWWVPTAIGLYRFSGVTHLRGLKSALPRVYGQRDGLPAREVFRLFEDSRGALWVSTIGGADSLAYWSEQRGEFPREKVAGDSFTLPDGPVSAFLEDRSGALWTGFWRGSLARKRDGRWSYFPKAAGAPPDFVYDMLQARDGDLWVASAAGLTRVRRPETEHPEFVTYPQQPGLNVSEATCLTEDLHGRIYVCTTIGVDRFDPREFPGPIRRYSPSDGLAATTPFSAYRDRAGRLWFGSTEGLHSLWPPPPRARKAASPVLTGVRIRGLSEVPLKWNGLHGIRLPSSQNDVEFEFAALSLRAAPIRYRHKLVGADEDWSNPAESGLVQYANLWPGRYEFWVESLGADGTRSSQALASFEILPPIWLRWWFLTLAAAALAGLVYAAHFYRLRSVLELERVRMRIATDLHDELGADLSRLAVLSETAQLAGGRPDAMQRIAELSRQMLDATSDVVWAIRPQKDRLNDLVQRMREFANDLFAMDGVRVSFVAPSQDARLDPEVRRQVFSIYKECLNNVARHSHASQVEVEVVLAGDELRLRVSDDGRGFSVEEAGPAQKRHGVSGMRWRAGMLKGAIEVDSRPGAGATVRLRVPLRKYAGT